MKTRKVQTTIYVVDPDKAAARAVCDLGAAHQCAVQAFATAEELWECLPAEPSGCVVLEVDLPGMSGLMLQEHLSNAGLALPVVMLAAKADVAVAVEAMRNGAIDFLQKPWHPLALWEAIQLGLQKSHQMLKQRAAQADVQARLDALTDEERTIMSLYLQEVPKKAIAKKLDVSMRTLDYRRTSLLRKMKVHSLLELSRLLADFSGQASGATRHGTK